MVSDVSISPAVAKLNLVRSEIGKIIVGQESVVDGVLICLVAGGHVLLEGVPGLGKTTLLRTLGRTLGLRYSRIQFTPDLMPADIVGSMIMETDDHGHKSLRFQPGPIFSNLVLADEINRATPKTQSALLEAMQERTVTAGTTTHELESPFLVMATQNPIEMEGTYPLPEAQLDRFMMNVVIDYLSEDEEVAVVSQTTSRKAEPIQPIFSGEDLLRCHDVVRRVPVAEEVVRYAVRLVSASRPAGKDVPDFVKQWVNWGAGTRASQYLVLGAKTRALLQGRAHVSFDDIKAMAQGVLRHRVMLNYRAEAEGVTVGKVISRLIEAVPTKL